MKKARKFLAVFTLCFSMLASYLPVYAAPAATTTCSTCGKTAYYSGSVEKAGWNIRDPHTIIINGIPLTCYIADRGYEDTYMCGCGIPTRLTRNEYGVHSYVH